VFGLRAAHVLVCPHVFLVTGSGASRFNRISSNCSTRNPPRPQPVIRSVWDLCRLSRAKDCGATNDHFQDDAGIITLRNEGVDHDHPPIQDSPTLQEEITFLRSKIIFSSISGLGAHLTSQIETIKRHCVIAVAHVRRVGPLRRLRSHLRHCGDRDDRYAKDDWDALWNLRHSRKVTR